MKKLFTKETNDTSRYVTMVVGVSAVVIAIGENRLRHRTKQTKNDTHVDRSEEIEINLNRLESI